MKTPRKKFTICGSFLLPLKTIGSVQEMRIGPLTSRTSSRSNQLDLSSAGGYAILPISFSSSSWTYNVYSQRSWSKITGKDRLFRHHLALTPKQTEICHCQKKYSLPRGQLAAFSLCLASPYSQKSCR